MKPAASLVDNDEMDEAEDDLEENQSLRHAGSVDSLKVALKAKGTTMEKFIAGGHLEILMKKYKPSKLKQIKSEDPIWSDTFTTLRPTDVVYPSVIGSQLQYGNGLMSKVIRVNLSYFSKLSKAEKRNAIDAIIGHFESIGSRFLEAPPRNLKPSRQSSPSYRALSLQGIITKVLYLFRIQTFRLRKKLRMASTSKENNSKAAAAKRKKKISPSGSSVDKENEKVAPNQNATKTAVTKKSKKTRKSVSKDTHPMQPKVASTTPTDEPKLSSKTTSDSSYAPEAKPSNFESKKTSSKACGNWHKAPLSKDLERRSKEMDLFVEGAVLDGLIKNFRASRLSQTHPADKSFNEVHTEFRSTDIVIPFPSGSRLHVGNALFNYVCAMNADTFAKLSKDKKRMAADALIRHFESLGTRILASGVPDGGKKGYKAYGLMSHEDAIDWVSLALGGTTNSLLPPLVIVNNKNIPGKENAGLETNYMDKNCDSKSTNTRLSEAKQLFQGVLHESLSSRRRSIERFLANADLYSLVNKKQHSTLQGDKMWGKVFKTVRPIDVLLPHNSRSQLGNALLNDVIQMNTEYFYSLASRPERQTAVEALVGAFERLGSRFLEALPQQQSQSDAGRTEVSYRVMSYRTIVEKIGKLFRTHVPRHIKKEDIMLDDSNAKNTSDSAKDSKKEKTQLQRAPAPRKQKKEDPVGSSNTKAPPETKKDTAAIAKPLLALDPGHMKEDLEGSNSKELSDSVKDNSLSAKTRSILWPFETLLNRKKRTVDEFIKQAKVEALLKTKRASRLSRSIDFPAECCSVVVSPCDVVFGDENSHLPGNVMLDIVLGRNQTFVRRLQNGLRKEVAVDSIIAHFESCGTRFLEFCTSSAGYKKMEYKPVTRKLLSLLIGSGDDVVDSEPAGKENNHQVESGESRNKRRPSRVSEKSASQSHSFSEKSQKKRAFSDLDALYQTCCLRNPKRTLLAPRPIFFE